MAVIDERRSSRFEQLLSPYLPPTAVKPIVRLIVAYNIHLKITRERHSKFGDYRLPSTAQPLHRISINGNLPPDGFLLVMLHEVAHMLTFVDHRRTVKPHGPEWQRHYSRLLIEFVEKGCFPADAVPMLRAYASSLPLNKALERKIDARFNVLPSAVADCANAPTLDSLPTGSLFRIKGNSARTFVSIEKSRTRWKCRDIATGRLYSVSAQAPVELVQAYVQK